MWNYLQGGKDNYALDRSAGDAMASAQPDSFYLARQAREFLSRAVRSVAAEAGVRQFLDLGCGLPAPQGLDNVHEVAQTIHPDARVVYVDNDRVVLAHAEALLTPLTPAGRCAYIEADVHDLGSILVQARETLDFTRPIGVVMIGILGHIAEFGEALGLIDVVMGAASKAVSSLWVTASMTTALCGKESRSATRAASRRIICAPSSSSRVISAALSCSSRALCRSLCGGPTSPRSAPRGRSPALPAWRASRSWPPAS